MISRTKYSAVLAGLLALLVLSAFQAPDAASLGLLRGATARYHYLGNAISDGYGLVPGLDHCFKNPGVGAMGYHYTNTSLLDTQLDPLSPESIVYAPDADGNLTLAALEFVVPMALWDAEGHTSWPSLYGRTFFPNYTLGVYVLHVWLWKDNPNGMFENWNPDVTCPA